ncbi:hypothetical protein [Veillonella rogosae]|uniref:hypothetical protein n=1 Tax=Veillonella rogosae TaxID=423477 RepID=UPI000AF39F82
MLRKSIIMMALAAAFTMNVSAVQIEVPKWQPPVPGADASIPANAYENYSYINEKAIQEAEIFSAKVQKNVEKPKTAIEKVFKEKTGLAQAVKLGGNSQNLLLSYFMKEKIIFVYLCQILACVEIRLNLNRVMGFYLLFMVIQAFYW